MKKIITLTLGLVFLATGLSFAQQTPSAPQTAVQAVEVGNKICPVSGNKVGEMSPPIKVEYKGKVYNLCCSGCIKIFENNPEKYSKIAEDEVQRQAQ